METNLSNSSFGFALATKHIPLNIGPQFFAAHPGVSLDCWAVLCWHAVQSPLVDD